MENALRFRWMEARAKDVISCSHSSEMQREHSAISCVCHAWDGTFMVDKTDNSRPILHFDVLIEAERCANEC